jgi:hypothetical protein
LRTVSSTMVVRPLPNGAFSATCTFYKIIETRSKHAPPQKTSCSRLLIMQQCPGPKRKERGVTRTCARRLASGSDSGTPKTPKPCTDMLGITPHTSDHSPPTATWAGSCDFDSLKSVSL